MFTRAPHERHRDRSRVSGPFLVVLTLGLALGASILLSLAADPTPAAAYPTGISGYSGNYGATCSQCHDGATSTATAVISGPTTVTQGDVVTYTVTVSGGPAVVAGFDIAIAATENPALPGLAAIDPGTQLLETDITHSSPRPFSGGLATFAVEWTVPFEEAGPATIYAASVSGNGDGRNRGDAVAEANLQIDIAAQVVTPGDPDCNGTVSDLADAVVVAQLLAGERLLGEDCSDTVLYANRVGADVDLNQEINTADVQAMLECAVGLACPSVPQA